MSILLSDYILIFVINRVLRLNLMVSANIEPLIHDRIQHIDIWDNHILLHSLILNNLREKSLMSLIPETRRVQQNPRVWRSPRVILVLIIGLNSIWVLDDRGVAQRATVVAGVARVVDEHIWLGSEIHWYLVLTAVECTRMVKVIMATKSSLSWLLKGLRLLEDAMVSDWGLFSLV